MAISRSRRQLLALGALGPANVVAPLLPQSAWAQGSDAPEKKEVKIGFIPLTDCASVVMASLKAFDAKYGVKFVLSKEASWAAIRDKLLNGELDYAHVLYGLVYGVQVGASGPQRDMAVLMTLNQNGQGITLSSALKDKGVTDGASLKALISKEKREYAFAQTFPTGTHAMWLNYWLAAHGINPMTDVKMITVPPPQMVANMRIGNMDGYCVGEPWNSRAVIDKIGFTASTTQAIWKDHPEKVLGATSDFVNKHPNTSRAVIAAVLEASRWIDTSDTHRSETAKAIADKSYVNTSLDTIEGRMLGRYDNGLGKSWTDSNGMRFFSDGAVNFPWLSDGAWFLTQQRRWGLLKADVDYLGIAKKVNRIDLYKQAAALARVNVPKELSRLSTLMDGVKWDVANAAQYASGFAIKAVK